MRMTIAKDRGQCNKSLLKVFSKYKVKQGMSTTKFDRIPIDLKTAGRERDIEFQAIQWEAFDEVESESNTDTESVMISTDDGDDYESGQQSKFCIRVYGVTENGESVCCNIRNFKPFFYARIPDTWYNHHISALKNYLEFRMEKDFEWRQTKDDDAENFAKAFEITKTSKKIFYGYQNDNKFSFLKFTFRNKKAFTAIQRILNKPMNIKRVSNDPTELTLFETNVDPIIRFTHKREVTPSGWCNVKFDKKLQESDMIPYSSCQINLSCSHTDVSPVEKSKVAPIRIASFDIECTSIDGSFPNPKRDGDQIIQIGTTFQTYGEKEPFLRHILCLGSCTSLDIPGSVVDCYDDEGDLLVAWAKLVRDLDPDIIIGYNIYGFDFWYMWERVESKYNERLDEFAQLGRMIDERSVMNKKVLASNAYGHNEYKIITTNGRFQIDIFESIKRDHKLNSYKLDSVSEHFLGDRKEDVSPSMIFKLFDGSAEDRAVIASYCIKDTELPLRILNKLNILPNMIEMSNVTMVPIDYLMTRGQQIKVFSQIVKETSKNNYVVPLIKRSDGKNEYTEEETSYVGATVLQAKTDAYYKPVSCLDFASLYPTIMMANNLCYSTWVRDPRILCRLRSELDILRNDPKEGGSRVNFVNDPDNKDDIYKVVTWDDESKENIHFFLQNKVGILPTILKNLLVARKVAKKQMNHTSDPFLKSLLNGKQLALKVSCNSVYGFCGASNGMLPSLAIASSVTTLGRQMIEKTTQIIEEKYDANVVYGDTDSVMVRFETPILKVIMGNEYTKEQEKTILKEAFDVAIEAGIYTTKKLNEDVYYPGIIDLEFEKVYCPYLLYSKKRYAGLKYEQLDEDPCIDIKGLQVVRRDNCELVKTICNKIINKLLIDKDTEGAVDAVKQTINDLNENKIDINNLVLSKSLKHIDYEKGTSGYKNENVPHVIVAKKMYKRDPMTAPKSSDRVPYVFIRTGVKKEPQYMKAEDPKYAVENDIPLDMEYYLKHQLQSPMCDLLAIINHGVEKEVIEEYIKVVLSSNVKILKKKEKEMAVKNGLGLHKWFT